MWTDRVAITMPAIGPEDVQRIGEVACGADRLRKHEARCVNAAMRKGVQFPGGQIGERRGRADIVESVTRF